MATSEKQVMVVGIDDCDHSTYALEWTLDHFFTPIPNPFFKLVLVHAKPSATSTVGVAGLGTPFTFHCVETELDFAFTCKGFDILLSLQEPLTFCQLSMPI